MRNSEVLTGDTGIGAFGTPNISNLELGGFFGWSPDIGNHLSEQAYVRKPAEIRVLESPRFFNLMPNPERWHASFRNLIERKVQRLEGWNKGLTVETDQHNAGGSGEFMHEPIDTKRAQTVPQLTFVEKYGRPIQRMLDMWIRYGIMDPDTKYALLTTFGDRAPQDLMADWYSATVLVYEPNPARRGVDKAWVTTNFWPLNNGDVSAVRDTTQSQEMLRLTVPFTGVSVSGRGIDQFATEIMNYSLSTNADPYHTRSFISEITPDVLRATQAGFDANMAATAANNVAPMR